MPRKYYLDTCIWRDYFEDRSDRFRPLGEWALELIKKVIRDEDILLLSDLMEEEILSYYSKEEMIKIFSVVPLENIERIKTSVPQLKESIQLGRKVNIPRNDALHAILARDSQACLVTRDKHFAELQEQVSIYKPEDLL